MPVLVAGGSPDVPALRGCSRCPLKHSERLPWSPLDFGSTQLGQILLLGLLFLCHCEMEPCTNSSVPVELSFTHVCGCCSSPPAPSPPQLAELSCRNPPPKIVQPILYFLTSAKCLQDERLHIQLALLPESPHYGLLGTPRCQQYL